MSKIVTKEQMEALLDAYIREQTAATEAAIEAYKRKVDLETEAKAQDITARMQQVTDDTKAQYDANAIQALIDRRRAEEQIARWGLTHSGSAKTRLQGVENAQKAAQDRTAAAERASLASLGQQLLTARKTAEGKKDEHAASARKTLGSKIAEKRVTLMKGVTV